MAKPSIGEVAASVLDPLMSDNFIFQIPSIPGNSQQSANALIMQCKSVTKPGLTINNVEVAVFGHQLEYVGQKTFSHDMTVEYFEGRNGVIHKTFEDWAEFCRRTQDQMGNYKADYARNGTITIFDVKGAQVAVYDIIGLWPSQVPDINFAGDSVSAITHSVTFKYDYYVRRA